MQITNGTTPLVCYNRCVFNTLLHHAGHRGDSHVLPGVGHWSAVEEGGDWSVESGS